MAGGGDAMRLATVPRHPRAAVQTMLGVSRQHMARLAHLFCQGRRLLSDRDVDRLTARRTRPARGPPTDG